MITPEQKDIDRFFSHVKKGENPNDCWEWTSYRMASGHGQFSFKGGAVYAYRFIYFVTNGPYDESLCVLHRCDNGFCVNPLHLFLGTMSDNMKDKVNKNRQSSGMCVGGVLSEDDVKEIVRLSRETNLTQKQIAKKFDVDRSQISRILSGRRWRHLSKELGIILA